MFDSLVESGSHKDDIARKGSFFLGAAAIYLVILVGLAVLSERYLEAPFSILRARFRETSPAPAPALNALPE